MTIIEFTGTPGCGKTSLCRALEEHMISRRHSAVNLSLKKNPGLWHTLQYRTFSADKELKKAIGEYVSSLPQNAQAQAKRECDKILEFSYVLREEKAKKHHAHYALFDEGCVQFLALSAGSDELTAEAALLAETVKRCLYSGNKTVIVHCTADEQDNIRRLLKHPNRADGFDRGTANEIAARLKQTEKNLLTAETDFGFRIRTEIRIDLVHNALERLLDLLRGGKKPHHQNSGQTEDTEKAPAVTSVFMSLKDFETNETENETEE